MLVTTSSSSTFIILFLITTCLITSTNQSIFDTFSGAIDLYDGMQCSLTIIEDYLTTYNRPMCCFYWKIRKIFNKIAKEKCETPENVQKILSGKLLNDYVDFSRMDCTKFPENSTECDTLWMFVLFITFGQIFLLITLIFTTIFLYWILRRRTRRQQNNYLLKSPSSTSTSSSSSSLSMYGYQSDRTTITTLSKSISFDEFNNGDNSNSNGWNSVTKLLTL